MFFIDEYYKRVKEIGDAPMLTDRDGKRTLSYLGFEELTGQIAHLLLKKGIKQGDHVVILLPRCSEYIAAEMALLKLGAVIIPLIPDYPKERIDYIVKDSGAVLVLDDLFLQELNENTIPADTVLEGDKISGDDRAMIIYTSGSTGNPKGVVYTRNNIDAQIQRGYDCIGDIHPLVFAAATTMSFCVTIMEYYWTTVLGGSVHIISDEVRSDAEKLAVYYAEHQITSGFISPRLLKNFESRSDSLKRVLVGSEKLVNIYSDQFEIINCFGQSETVSAATIFLLDKPYDNTPIGKPLKGIEIMLVDETGNPVEDGEEGQICLIGDFPHEYNNLPEQTEKVFKPLLDGRTIIYTGDIGKILPDGNLLYLNRNDWMLKIHGQRVEPGEIEAVMNKVEGITGSVVKAFDNADGTMLVCGFYTENKAVDKAIIREALERQLPLYMIPGTLIKMEAFPVNANGKIDRKSIKKPDPSKLKAEYEKAENATEEALCHAMEAVLGIEQIGRNDNFMELGGNSLNAVMLCAECDIKGLAPQLVMIGQTPAGIAKLIKDESFCEKPKLQISGTIRNEYPLSFSQRYQYDVCHSHQVPIDVNDMDYFFALDDAVDIQRLKKAVEEVVKEHPIYQCHIDVEQNLLLTDHGVFEMKEITLTPEDFDSYRDSYYRRVRDYRRDPLFESQIIRTDEGKTYLFISVCHFVYDGKSIQNLLRSITEKYDGTEKEAAQATIFDLIDYEMKLKENKELIRTAQDVFEDNYKNLKPVELFDKSVKYATGFSMPILEDISQEEIDACLKKYGISILTLFEGAMEMTIEKIFGIKDFCYMNVYDGRVNHLLNDAHGAFAKSVFVRSSKRAGSLKEFFESIKKQYQKLVYFDVFDTFDIVNKYPAIQSGISFNYRDFPAVSIRLNGRIYYSKEFIDEFFAVNKPYPDMDFIVNKLPAGYGGYNVVISSTKVSDEFAGRIASSFNDTLTAILKA